MCLFYLLFAVSLSIHLFVSPDPKPGNTCLKRSSPCELSKAIEKTCGQNQGEITFLQGTYQFSDPSQFSSSAMNLTLIGENKSGVFFEAYAGGGALDPLFVLDSSNLQIVNINVRMFRRKFFESESVVKVKIISSTFKDSMGLLNPIELMFIDSINLNDVVVDGITGEPFFEITGQQPKLKLKITNSAITSSLAFLKMTSTDGISIICEHSSFENMSYAFHISEIDSLNPHDVELSMTDLKIKNVSETFFLTDFSGQNTISLRESSIRHLGTGFFRTTLQSSASIDIINTLFEDNTITESLFHIEVIEGHEISFNSSISHYIRNQCPTLYDSQSSTINGPLPCQNGGILQLYGIMEPNQNVFIYFMEDFISENLINENNHGTIVFTDLKTKHPDEEIIELSVFIVSCNFSTNHALGESMGGVIAIEQNSDLILTIINSYIDDSLSNAGGVLYVHGVDTTRNTFITIEDSLFTHNRVRYDPLGLMLNQGGVLFFHNDLTPPPNSNSNSVEENDNSKKISNEILSHSIPKKHKDEKISKVVNKEKKIIPNLEINIIRSQFWYSLAIIGGVLSVHGYPQSARDSEVLIQRSEFFTNQACYYGGAIFAVKINLTITEESHFVGNSATMEGHCSELPFSALSYGGVMVSVNSDVKIEDAGFLWSSVKDNGGSLASVDDNSFFVYGAYLWKGSAGSGGGNVFYSGNGQVFFDSKTYITSGEAPYGGGLLWDRTVKMDDSLVLSHVEGNQASQCGGGIYYSSFSSQLPPVNISTSNKADNGIDYLTRPHSFSVIDGVNECKALPKSSTLGSFECTLQTIHFFDVYGQRIKYPSFYPFQLSIQFRSLPQHRINTVDVKKIQFYVYSNQLSDSVNAHVGLLRANGDTVFRDVIFLFQKVEKKKSVIQYWWIIVVVLVVFLYCICFVLGMVCCQHRLKLLLSKRKYQDYVYLD